MTTGIGIVKLRLVSRLGLDQQQLSLTHTATERQTGGQIDIHTERDTNLDESRSIPARGNGGLIALGKFNAHRQILHASPVLQSVCGCGGVCVRSHTYLRAYTHLYPRRSTHLKEIDDPNVNDPQLILKPIHHGHLLRPCVTINPCSLLVCVQ